MFVYATAYITLDELCKHAADNITEAICATVPMKTCHVCSQKKNCGKHISRSYLNSCDQKAKRRPLIGQKPACKRRPCVCQKNKNAAPTTIAD